MSICAHRITAGHPLSLLPTYLQFRPLRGGEGGGKVCELERVDNVNLLGVEVEVFFEEGVDLD